jgi:hypothetical protein
MHQLGKCEDSFPSNMLSRRKILIVFGKLRQMLMTDVQETSTLAHGPGTLNSLPHR